MRIQNSIIKSCGQSRCSIILFGKGQKKVKTSKINSDGQFDKLRQRISRYSNQLALEIKEL